MKDVGDRFGRGELILPFVLQSAEVMKKAVAHLEQFLEKKEGATKGTVVIATVFGDVHDIGKNLVNTILTNNGYTVVDLGKQVPMNTILEKAVEVERRRDRSFGAAGVDQQADADLRAGAGCARLELSGDRRRRRDQSRFRPADRAARRRQAFLRSRPLLCERRVRRARTHGRADGRRATAHAARRSGASAKRSRSAIASARSALSPTAGATRRPSRAKSPTCRRRRFGGYERSRTSICATFGRASICAASFGFRGARPTPKVKRTTGCCARNSSRG